MAKIRYIVQRAKRPACKRKHRLPTVAEIKQELARRERASKKPAAKPVKKAKRRSLPYEVRPENLLPPTSPSPTNPPTSLPPSQIPYIA